MSTFSSVIHKPGKKFAPKPTPRRNVPRSAQQVTARQVNASPTPTPQPEIAATSYIASATSGIEETPNTGEISAVPSDQGLPTPPTSLPEFERQHGQSFEGRASASTLRRLAGQTTQTESRSSAYDDEDEVLGSRDMQSQPGVVSAEDDRNLVPATTSVTTRRGVKRKQINLIPAVATDAAPSPLSSVPHQGTIAPSNSRKKRKSTPLATPAFIFATGTIITPGISGEQGSSGTASKSSRRSPRQPQSTDKLLQDATSQAATVSTLADAIDGRTRSTREQIQNVGAAGTADTTPDRPIERRREAHSSGRLRRSGRNKAVAEIAAEIVSDAVNESRANGIPGRKRRQTPDDAEDHEIEPTEVRMGELCKDTNLGKKSLRETAMQNIDWPAVKKRQKEEAAEAERRRLAGEKDKRNRIEIDDPTIPILPQMDLDAEGNIIVVDESRQLDRQAQVIEDAARLDQNVIEEDHLTKRVNQSTVGRKRGVGVGTRWDESMTARFYKGIRMFGTDFMMISSMFPGMTRRHVKLKYVKEEKTNLAELHHNLINREPVNLDEFEKITAKIYEDPKKLQDQLEAQEKKLRDEDDERRAREYGEPHPEEDNEPILQSREQDTAEAEDEDHSDREETVATEGDASVTENRFGSLASQIVRDATTPKKKRKHPGPAKKRDILRRGRRPMEGIEERLGPVDEVTR